MAVLALRLAGPMQSWGDASRFTQRLTRSEPTKSGVLGLLAAAQGRRRTDAIEDLAGLTFGVRVDQPGRLVRDFQTAIRWQDKKPMPLSYRYYLADAVFVACVEGDRALLEGLDTALQEPAFPLFLGRRSCPVSGQLRLGVHEGHLVEVFRELPWQAMKWYRKKQGKKVDVALYLDAHATASVDDMTREVVRDVPLSYDPARREYGWRDVVSAAPVEFDNGDGHDRMDFMAALGGA